MNRYTLHIFSLFWAFAFSAQLCVAQSKKLIRLNKIKSATEHTTKMVDGKELSYKSTYWTFDTKTGETTEKTEFFPDGSVRKKSVTKYDSKENIIEETEFSVKDKTPDDGSRNTKTTYKYNSSNDKTEEVQYDGSGKVLKRIVFSYNANGNKTMEVKYDGENKLLKKEVFTYDKKGLKLEHKIYDSENVLLETRKFTYGY
jgi:hypothetical protein